MSNSKISGERQGKIKRELERLNTNIDLLFGGIKLLKNKLSSIIRVEEEQCPSVANKLNSEAHTEIGKTIFDDNLRIKTAIQDLEEIYNRLEI